MSEPAGETSSERSERRESGRFAPDWEGEEVPEIRTCGCCGHFDNCQMMCNLDFEDASEDMECRHWLEADSDD